MTPDDIRSKMEKLADFVREAEHSVRDGMIRDLSGLDREVTAICKKALTLPPVEARDLQPVMAELIGGLERLGQALVAYKEEQKKP